MSLLTLSRVAVRSLDLEFHAHGADCGFSYTRGAIQEPRV